MFDYLQKPVHYVPRKKLYPNIWKCNPYTKWDSTKHKRVPPMPNKMTAMDLLRTMVGHMIILSSNVERPPIIPYKHLMDRIDSIELSWFIVPKIVVVTNRNPEIDNLREIFINLEFVAYPKDVPIRMYEGPYHTVLGYFTDVK